jgi:hypothetical protein
VKGWCGIGRGFSHIVTLIVSAKTGREGRSWLSAYRQELDKSDNIEGRLLGPIVVVVIYTGLGGRKMKKRIPLSLFVILLALAMSGCQPAQTPTPLVEEPMEPPTEPPAEAPTELPTSEGRFPIVGVEVGFDHRRIVPDYKGTGTPGDPFVLIMPPLLYDQLVERMRAGMGFDTFVDTGRGPVVEVRHPFPAWRGDVFVFYLWTCSGYENYPRAVAITQQITGREVLRVDDIDTEEGAGYDLQGGGRVEYWQERDEATVQILYFPLPLDGPFVLNIWPEEDNEFCYELSAHMDVSQRPRALTDAHVQQMAEITQQAANGEIDQEETKSRLESLTREVGADAFAWLVRRVPVYDAESGSMMTLDSYMHDFLDDYDAETDSRFGQDPVGTAVDLMFGNYDSVDEIEDWLGFGGLDD